MCGNAFWILSACWMQNPGICRDEIQMILFETPGTVEINGFSRWQKKSIIYPRVIHEIQDRPMRRPTRATIDQCATHECHDRPLSDPRKSQKLSWVARGCIIDLFAHREISWISTVLTPWWNVQANIINKMYASKNAQFKFIGQAIDILKPLTASIIKFIETFIDMVHVLCKLYMKRGYCRFKDNLIVIYQSIRSFWTMKYIDISMSRWTNWMCNLLADIIGSPSLTAVLIHLKAWSWWIYLQQYYCRCNDDNRLLHKINAKYNSELAMKDKRTQEWE